MPRFLKRKLLILETNLDDMNPQWFDPLMDCLFEAGALDVVLIPSIMKKSRPAVLLQVLTEPRRQEKILEIIFEESTTLGVRSYPVTRFELKREFKKVKTPYGVVTMKIGRDTTGQILNNAPEFESCRQLSRKKRVPIKNIYRAANLLEK